MTDILGLARRGRRPVPMRFVEAPLDIRAAGYRGMLILNLPFRREWNETQRIKVAQRVANAALAELQAAEGDLV